METEKENLNKLRASTKIPLPVEPLPALPQHLLLDNKKGNVDTEERYPLKTIQSQPNNVQAGTSRDKVVPHKSKCPIYIDTRYVTIRNKSELDWHYKVYKDGRKKKEPSVVITDDKVESKTENGKKSRSESRYLVEDDKKSRLIDSGWAVTPCLESNRVKNIKKSLKRPHSRELQGLVPVAKKDKLDEDQEKEQLICNDQSHSGKKGTEFLQKSYMICLVKDYTTDMFNYMLCTEKKPLDVPKTTSITRACVINWLIKINGLNGNPAVIQTACWYLDSVLGTCLVNVDKMQLVAAACYWIAQKLQGPMTSASVLAKYASHAFTPLSLLAAERAVLNKLKFPLQPVVPQDFIAYLSWWCNNEHPKEIEIAATFLCISGLMVDKAFCNEYPSVIAGAAMRNSLILLGKKELLTHLQLCPVYQTIEKKAANMSYTCSLMRRAVRTVAAPIYEYKAPLKYYGLPPTFVAQRVADAANEFSVIDIRNIVY